MGKRIITFGDNKISKQKFNHYKNLIFKKDLDIDNIFSSREKSYKYFIGYMDDDYKIKPLYIMLPKGSRYVKYYDGKAKWI